VQTLTVIQSAPAGWQRLLRDDSVVPVPCVDNQVRRLGNDNFVAEQGNTQGCEHIVAVVGHVAGTRMPIAVSVVKNEDLVALRVILGLASELAPLIDRHRPLAGGT